MINFILIIPLLFGLLALEIGEKSSKSRPQAKEPINAPTSFTMADMEEKLIGTPTKLLIPAIKLNITIEAMGLTDEKIVETPANTVGWFKHGAKPGEVGTASLNGHFINDTLEPGVFFNLSKLKKGDDIFINDENGQRFHFVVYEKELVDVEKFPIKKVYSSTMEASLNLVTCAGEYLAGSNNYSQRTIIYSRLVD